MEQALKILAYKNYFTELKERFNSISRCRKMWCSTCGGYGHFILREISQDKKDELLSILKSADIDHNNGFGEWDSVITELFPNYAAVVRKKVQKNKLNEITKVDKNNIKDVERYIFYNRYYYENYEKSAGEEYNYWNLYYYPYKELFDQLSEEEINTYQIVYNDLLQIAIKNVVITHDASLIESLAIILKSQMSKYEGLSDLCMELCNDRVIFNCLGKRKEEESVKEFKYLELIEQIRQEFKIDFYGDHGVYHWKRVYENSQKLSTYYDIESEVFELFAILHDSKRHDEYEDRHHGIRAAGFTQKLLRNGVIELEQKDCDRLLYACANHTKSDKNDPLFNDLIVQICFDSDRLDIGRVGYDVDPKYLATEYAKSLLR